MIIDSSVLAAIFLNEPDGSRFLDVIKRAESKSISAGTLIELGIVLERRIGGRIQEEIDEFIDRAEIEVIAVDRQQSNVARRAYRQFGRARHPAGLNFGDCFSYALSITAGEPLLFKGGDFALTDVEVFALPT